MQIKNKTKTYAGLVVVFSILLVLCVTGLTFAWLAFRERLTSIEGMTGKIALTTSGVNSEQNVPVSSLNIVSGTPIVDKVITLQKTESLDAASCYVRVKAMLETSESLTADEQDWLDEVNATIIQPLSEQKVAAFTYVNSITLGWKCDKCGHMHASEKVNGSVCDALCGGTKFTELGEYTFTLDDMSLFEKNRENSFIDYVFYDASGNAHTVQLAGFNKSEKTITVSGIEAGLAFKTYNSSTMNGKEYRKENRSAFLWQNTYAWTQSWGGYYYLIDYNSVGGVETLIEITDDTIYAFCDEVKIPYDASLFYEESAISINLTFKIEVQAIQSKNLDEEGYLDAHDKLTKDKAVELMNEAFNESFVETVLVKYDTSHYKWGEDDEGFPKLLEQEINGSPIVRPEVIRKNKDNKFVIVPSEDPVWRSKRFEGWYKDSNFRELFIPKKADREEGYTKEVNSNITLYAKWTQLVYLSFEYMSGEETTAGPLKYNGYYDETKTLPVVYKSLNGTPTSTTLEEKGVTLIWFAENNLNSDFYLGGSKIIFKSSETMVVDTNELPQEYQFNLTEETTLYGAWFFTGELVSRGAAGDFLSPFETSTSMMSALHDDSTGKNNISYCSSPFSSIYIPSISVSNTGEISYIDGLKGENENESVFSQGSKVTRVLYGTTITTLHQYVFVGCSSLRNLHIPSNIKHIDSNAIYKCKYLQTVEVGDDVEVESKTTINSGFISNCLVLVKVKFCKSVDKIAGKIFNECYAVTIIEFSDLFNDVSGIRLDRIAFDDLKVVEVVDLNPAGGSRYTDTDFNWYGVSTYTISNQQTIFYGHDVNGNAFRVDEGTGVMIGLVGDTKLLAIPNYVNCGGYNYRITRLGENFTYGSKEVENIAFNDFLQVVMKEAFINCTALRRLNLPHTLLVIQQSAFKGCFNIAEVSVRVDASLTTIEAYAFEQCAGLTTFTIPENVTSIGSKIFKNCTDDVLTTINYYPRQGVGNGISEDAFELIKTSSSKFRVYVRAENYHDLIAGDLDFLVDVAAFENGAVYTALNNINYKELKELAETNPTEYNRRIKIIAESCKNVKNYVRSFEKYNMSFVRDDELLSKGAVLSFDYILGNTTDQSVRFGDLFLFVHNGFTDSTIFQGWNTKINGCGDDVEPWNLFGYHYSTKTLFSIAKIDDKVIANFGKTFLTATQSFRINSFSGSASILDIPNRLKHTDGKYYPVTEIKETAFRNKTTLVRVTFLAGIQSIGYSAFEGCTALSSVVLATELITIGNYAFRGCTNLASVSMPNTVTTVGQEAFKGCSSLQSINFPSSVETIGDSAFENCTALRTATFVNNPEKSKKIGVKAFKNCENLRNAKFPVALESIGEEAFSGCVSLYEVDLSLSIRFETIEMGTFNGCKTLDTVKLTNTITTIEDNAFKDCKNLITINMPYNLKDVGAHAFDGCVEMQVIELADTMLETVGEYAFFNCKFAFFDLEMANVMTLRSVGTSAFEGCTNMRTLILPYVSITAGDNLFKGCTSLTSAIVNTSGIIYKTSTFENCTSLESAVINSSDIEIGKNSFKNCTSLLRITFQAQLTTVKESAFEGCKKLVLADFTETNLTDIEKKAFSGCSEISSVFTKKSGLKTIGVEAFSGCVLLSDIGFREYTNLTTIGEKAFSNCGNLGTFVIPTSVTSVGNRIFYNVPDNAIEIIVINTPRFNISGNWNASGVTGAGGTEIKLTYKTE